MVDINPVSLNRNYLKLNNFGAEKNFYQQDKKSPHEHSN